MVKNNVKAGTKLWNIDLKLKGYVLFQQRKHSTDNNNGAGLRDPNAVLEQLELFKKSVVDK